MQDTLSQKLESMRSTAATTGNDMQSWRADVARLYRDVADWLIAEQENKDVRLFEQPVRLHEPDFGAYGMVQLAIQLETGPLLLLVPRGLRVVGAVLKHGKRVTGAKGRIDLVNFEDRQALAFYRGPKGEWFVPTPEDSEPWAPLNKDRFRQAMASLL